MQIPLDSSALWRATLGTVLADAWEAPRSILRQSLLAFRGRVAHLVSTIGSELPGLTVHDITHLDALWRVADQIAGDAYPLNPAEAFVLGGAFLLHDAAHVIAAYPGGMDDIRGSVQWQDLIAQRYGGSEPNASSAEEKSAIFQVLRHLHAEQAHKLANIAWAAPNSGEPLFLIENFELRKYYGDLIGEIAASHHWPAHLVAQVFAKRVVPCPAFLSPATWEVDALKVALLLRTADAAHLDAGRAPWFLFALRQPAGVSSSHWQFQSKLGQPTRTGSGELRLSAGASFGVGEREAWWLAFDAARMVDGELRSANEILREEGRQSFAATRVIGVESAESFAREVPAQGWIPLDVAPKVGDLKQLIARLGGAALYGENLAAPLRELLQNGLDAVRALRALGGLDDHEGEIEVTATPAEEGQWWIRVTDTGIGMSRHVLTNVLLDFGSSFWSTDGVREEHPGLAKAKFDPVGKFGIGFFSVFMLGNEVSVTTRRYEAAKHDSGVHWQLRFENGLASRPVLLQPAPAERLKRSGTSVAVKLSADRFDAMLRSTTSRDPISSAFKSSIKSGSEEAPDRSNRLAWLVARLCPASSVNLTTRIEQENRYAAVRANDWLAVEDRTVLARSQCSEVPLVPLRSPDGTPIGRVGLVSRSYLGGRASIVHHGVVCGQAPGLAGIIEARANNLDAKRVAATPAGDLATWKRWAAEVLQLGLELELNDKLRLHALLPDEDLAVWLWGTEELTLGELVVRLESVDEVLLHDGFVDHDSDDEVSSSRFSSRFTAVAHLIRIPSLGPQNTWDSFFLDGNVAKGRTDFPWSIGADPIDYEARLLNALEPTWGPLEEEEEDIYVVGDVDGTEITRSAIKFSRST